MALRYVAFLHHLLHVGWQLQQAEQVRNRRAINLYAASQLFLRALVLIDVALERLGLFDRVQVFALHVFDDGQLGHLAVVDLANLHRHLAPVGGHGRTQPAFASNQFEAVLGFANDQRLQNAVGTNAISQVGDLGLIERLTRLVGVPRDRIAVQPHLAVLIAREPFIAGELGHGGRNDSVRLGLIPRTAQQCFQPTS